MKTSAWVLLALALACLRDAECIPPTLASVMEGNGGRGRLPADLGPQQRDLSAPGRLPGLCRRLRKRRLGYLCHKGNYCWLGRSQRRSQSGQVCRCPRGSTCLRVFIHSL